MRKYRYHYYRAPRTTAERRSNQNGWCRAKRNPNSLPTTYDDLPIRHNKSWKSKRKKQYRSGRREHEHSITIYSHVDEWKLKCYFEDHDIPYSIKGKKRVENINR
jgi:hypothetical protein